MDPKSIARVKLAEQQERRTVLVEHKPVVHGALTDCFAHGAKDACHCRAECTCGAAVVLPGQVATFVYNHAEPGPQVRRT